MLRGGPTQRRVLVEKNHDRLLSSSTNKQPPQRPAFARAVEAKEAEAAATTSKQQYDMNAEPESVTVNSNIRAKNAGLAFALSAFCLAVAIYSMNAVGQSGVNEDGEDPLALLKKEAANAQEKRSQQEQSDRDQQQLMAQFEAGSFDPDQQQLDELEAASAAGSGKRKKPWWKFWARG